MPNSSAGYFIVNAAPAAISSTSCRPRHPILLACLASLFFTTPGHGAAPPDAGQVLREMRGGERDMRPEKAEEPVIEALPRPAIKLPEGIRIPVGAFRVSGNSAIPSAELDALVRPWAGQTLDLAGLNDAAGAITRHYQSRGYLLSYAYLPAQKVVDGVVEIAVLEGRVDAVQVVAAQDVRLRDDVIPYGLVNGIYARLSGLNIVGMRRRKITKDRLAVIRSFFRELFLTEGQFAERLERVRPRAGEDPAIAEILAFIDDRKRRRRLCMARNDDVVLD